MDVRNCKGCGKLFNYMSGAQLCPECRAKLEKKFSSVKDYIGEHPQASISQVAEDMDVSVKQIKQWVKEERLILSEASLDVCCVNTVADRSQADASVTSVKLLWQIICRVL